LTLRAVRRALAEPMSGVVVFPQYGTVSSKNLMA
jgi:hypothetical protein